MLIECGEFHKIIIVARTPVGPFFTLENSIYILPTLVILAGDLNILLGNFRYTVP
jgi:hypothetical protein